MSRKVRITEGNTSFSEFERDLESAVMMSYVQAGYDNFHEETMVEDINREEVNATDAASILRRTYAALGRNVCASTGKSIDKKKSDAPLLTCGACGYRNFMRGKIKFVTVNIMDARFGCFICPDDEVKRIQTLRKKCGAIELPMTDDCMDPKTWVKKDLTKVYGRFEAENKMFYYHPQFVKTTMNAVGEATYSTELCYNCDKVCPKVPKNSIAGGKDFGDPLRIGITTPTFPIEDIILAIVRSLSFVIQFQHGGQGGKRYKLNGHCISFSQDGPYVAAEKLTIIDIVHKYVRCQFLEGKGKVDRLMTRVLKNTEICKVRPHVIYQYLAVEKYLNVLIDDTMELPTLSDLNDQIQQIHKILRDECLKTTDEQAVQLSRNMMEHVSNAPPTENSTKESKEEDENVSVEMRHSLVTEKDNEKSVDLNFLKYLARSFSIDSYGITRSNEAICEFVDNEKILAGSFPSVFMLGEAYGRKKGCITMTERQHLFCQYTCCAAQKPQLQFVIMSQLMKHRNIISAFLGLNGDKNKDNVDAFYEMVNDTNFSQNLIDAMQHPKGKKAKNILGIATKIVASPHKLSIFGSSYSTDTSLGSILNMGRQFGPPGAFYTVSLNTTNNPNAIRLTIPSTNNDSFPAKTNPAFFTAMKKSETFTYKSVNTESHACENQTLELDCQSLPAKMRQNPIATAHEYNAFIQVFCSEMLGITPVTNQITGEETKISKRTVFPKKGTSGHMLGFSGRNDTTAAGNMHLHLMGYPSLKPEIMGKSCTDVSLQNAVGNALDSTYSCELPTEIHTMRLLRQWKAENQANLKKIFSIPYLLPSNMSIHPTLLDTNVHTGQMFCQLCASRVQPHKCCFTCELHNSGKCGCRSCMPRGLVTNTKPVQLLPALTKSGVTSFTVKDTIDEPPALKDTKVGRNTVRSFSSGAPSFCALNEERRIISWESRRPTIEQLLAVPNAESTKQMLVHMLMKEIDCMPKNIRTATEIFLKSLAKEGLTALITFINKELPKSNGHIVSFNPLVSAVCGSNTAMYFMGNITQAINASYYAGGYILKSNVTIGQAMLYLEEGKNIFDKYGSSAEDATTKKRQVQFIATHMFNKLDVLMEVSDYLCASTLLGGTTDICSHNFISYNGNEHVTYIIQSKEFDTKNNITNIPTNDIAIERSVFASYGLFQGVYSNGLDVVHGNSKNALGGTEVSQRSKETLLASRWVLVPYVIHYTYRGYALRHLSRHEWTRCITVQLKKKSSKKTTCTKEPPKKTAGRGRKGNEVFPLNKRHPLFKSHEQVLRSKQVLPRYTNKPPNCPHFPPPPEEEVDKFNAWKEKADTFAFYILAAVRPEPDVYKGQQNKYDYSWETLCAYNTELEQSSLKIDQFRQTLIKNLATNFNPRDPDTDVLRSYMSRDRNIWDEEHRRKRDYDARYRKQVGQYYDDDTQGNENLYAEMKESCMLGRNCQNDYRDEDIFILNVGKELSTMCDAAIDYHHQESTTQTTEDHLKSSSVLHMSSPNIDALYNIIKALCFPKENNAENSIQGTESLNKLPPNEGRPWLFQHLSTFFLSKIKQELITLSPSKDKQYVIMTLAEYFCDKHALKLLGRSDEIKNLKPPRIVLLGEPGAGKSFVYYCIDILTDMLNRSFALKATNTGIAASTIGGYTLYTAYNVKPATMRNFEPRDLQEVELLKLQQDRDIENVSCLVFDEISTITPSKLYCAEKRCHQLFESNEPFGNMPVILSGDFHQHIALPRSQCFPQELEDTRIAARRNLPDDRMKKSEPANIMCNLIMDEFEWIELDVQNRAGNKSTPHTEMVNRLYHNGQLTMDDLKRIKRLSIDDMKKDPSWMFAPIITRTNVERKHFEFIQAVRFGKYYNKPVVRWKESFIPAKQFSKIDVNRDINPNDPNQYQYWVEGAPAILGHNVSTNVKLVNGSEVLTHSLTFRDTWQANEFTKMYEKANDGEIITLNEAPYSSNIEIYVENENDSDRTKTWKALLRSRWDPQHTMVPGKLVIPVTQIFKKGYNMHLQCEKVGYVKGKQCPKIPFFLNFAMTSEKAQSQTMSKVILYLAHRKGRGSTFREKTLHHLNVDLSRVKCDEDMRILMPESQTYEDLSYIETLEFDKSVKNLMNSLEHVPGQHRTCRYFNQNVYDELLGFPPL